MFTDAQKIIIKEICSIQFSSLEDIVQMIDLGENSDGDQYEEILAEAGCSRKDFDDQLKITYKQFQLIEDEPDRLFDLDELDLIVFKYILHNYESKWIEKYPKAVENLWYKFLLHDMMNEIHKQ